MPLKRTLHVFIAVTGLLLFGTAVAWFGVVQQQRAGKTEPFAKRAPQLPEGTEAPSGTPKQDASQQDSGKGPSFDVIRVEPSGEAVIAGRAPPGATVRMLRNGKTYAETVADDSGSFAFVLPPLLPGAQQLVLHATSPDGTRQQSRESVTVVISEDPSTKPLVTLASPDTPTAVLSVPVPPNSVAASPDKVPSLSRVQITAIDAEAGGRLMVSGQSAPGALVQFYLNDSLVAPAKASQEGRVSFTIGKGVRPGSYRVRLDEVDPVSGSVKTRAEVAFAVPVEAGEAAAAEARPKEERAGGALLNTNDVLVPAVNTALVAKRESLWRISSRVYGKGLRYTEIYQANQAQIRNPNLIYPGQIFVVPSDLKPAVQKP